MRRALLLLCILNAVDLSLAQCRVVFTTASNQAAFGGEAGADSICQVGSVASARFSFW
jgi:hypothetical protein